MRRLATLATLVLLAVAGCGSSDSSPTTKSTASAPQSPASSTSTAAPATTNPTPRPTSGTILVAALGDSITAGSPIYDPDPQVRAQIGAQLNPQSQFEYWFNQAHPRYEFRNCGIFGQRTDQIAQRLDTCAKGAKILIVQGGINDIAQGRPVTDAADDMRSMFAAGKKLGLKVFTVEVLPWNNGYPQADPLITQLNGLIHTAAKAEDVPVFPWYKALEDPSKPGRMRADLTIDGDHPSVAGYKLLASKVTLP